MNRGMFFGCCGLEEFWKCLVIWEPVHGSNHYTGKTKNSGNEKMKEPRRKFSRTAQNSVNKQTNIEAFRTFQLFFLVNISRVFWGDVLWLFRTREPSLGFETYQGSVQENVWYSSSNSINVVFLSSSRTRENVLSMDFGLPFSLFFISFVCVVSPLKEFRSCKTRLNFEPS